MPDHIEPIASARGKVDWPAMLHDLEKRIETLSDALDGVRLSMRRLVLAEPWLEEAIAGHPPQIPPEPAYPPAPLEPAPERRARQPDAVQPVAAAEPLPEDEAAARDAVRRAVEEARAELSGTRPAAARQHEPEKAHHEEIARDPVRRAVMQARAELTHGTPQPHETSPVHDEEAAREAVRQAVAQARGEMAGSGQVSLADDAATPGPSRFNSAQRPPPPHTVRPESLHPPTLTIEDPEGRVELARVYNLLKHVDRVAQSSLLSYTSRQVSVALGEELPVPSEDELAAAVREVLERQCEVRADGNNLIVRLGSNYLRAA